MTPDKSKTAIFDIDGTLLNILPIVHLARGVTNYDAFFLASIECEPNEKVVAFKRELLKRGFTIILLTARNRQYEPITVNWFSTRSIGFHGIYMRRDGDHRPDKIVKAELYQQIIEDGYNPVLAVEDNPTVHELWTEVGLPFHIVPGWNEGENPDDFDASDSPFLALPYTP